MQTKPDSEEHKRIEVEIRSVLASGEGEEKDPVKDQKVVNPANSNKFESVKQLIMKLKSEELHIKRYPEVQNSTALAELLDHIETLKQQ